MQILQRRKKNFERDFLSTPLPPLSRGLRDYEKHLLDLMTQSLQLDNLKLCCCSPCRLGLQNADLQYSTGAAQVNYSFICILHLLTQSVKLDKLKFILLVLFSLSFTSPNLQYCTCALMCRWSDTLRISRLSNV
jgi:hypothetical protein